MENKPFVKKKRNSKWLGVFLVIALTILPQIALLRIHVRTVDQKTTSLLVIAENRVHVQIVVGDKSSSNSCPKYLEILQRRRQNQFF